MKFYNGYRVIIVMAVMTLAVLAPAVLADGLSLTEPGRQNQREQANKVANRSPRVHVSDDIQVQVKNPEGIENNNKRFKFNDRCFACQGGELNLIKTIREKVLVRYMDPVGQGLAVNCPNGTYFWMAATDYDKAEDVYRRTIADREAEKEEIRRILLFGDRASLP